MPVPHIPAEVLDHICAHVSRDSSSEKYFTKISHREIRLKTLHSLTLTSRAFYNTCIPYLYHILSDDIINDFVGLARRLSTAPELSKHVSKIEKHIRKATETRELISTLFHACADIKELSITTDRPLHISVKARSIPHTRLTCIYIYTTGGMGQTELAGFLAACPNLEEFELSGEDARFYNGTESVSPSGVMQALEPCSKTLRSLCLYYYPHHAHTRMTQGNQIASHDDYISDLRHFTKLESLDVLKHDMVVLDKFPVSLKELEIGHIPADQVDEVRNLARRASEHIPNLRRVILRGPVTPAFKPLKSIYKAANIEFEVNGH